MADNVLDFSAIPDQTVERRESPRMEIPLAKSNPYNPTTSPPDILQYLPPNGEPFSLFSDPYAKMVYYLPKTGGNSARYWMEQRMENHSFTDNELNLINFLSQHRCATRSQIAAAIFNKRDTADKIKQFIQKCHNRGIISAFSWVSPCMGDRKKPLIYGLTRIGAEAAEKLFHIRVHERYKFHAVNFPNGAGPKMNSFYPYLTSNELYCKLKSVDRLISWEREPSILLDDQSTFKPAFVAEVIKDAGQLLQFWIEPVRITNGWYSRVVQRFRDIQTAYDKSMGIQKPNRIIVIADSDSRVPIISAMAEEYMPDVVLRFTTDERLLQGMNEQTFLQCDPEGRLIASAMPFLLENAPGMKASEYLSHQVIDISDDFEDL